MFSPNTPVGNVGKASLFYVITVAGDLYNSTWAKPDCSELTVLALSVYNSCPQTAWNKLNQELRQHLRLSPGLLDEKLTTGELMISSSWQLSIVCYSEEAEYLSVSN